MAKENGTTDRLCPHELRFMLAETGRVRREVRKVYSSEEYTGMERQKPRNKMYRNVGGLKMKQKTKSWPSQREEEFQAWVSGIDYFNFKLKVNGGLIE